MGICLMEQPELRIEDLHGFAPDVNRRTLQRDLQQAVAEQGIAQATGRGQSRSATGFEIEEAL